MVEVGPFQINLIPSSTWHRKIETLLGESLWNAIRERELKRAGYRCEICGSKDKLHVHEIWEFDYEKCLQMLRGFKVVCDRCHLVLHLGYASYQGRLEEAIEHMRRVAGIGSREAILAVLKAFEEWQERDRRTCWKIEIPEHLLRFSHSLVPFLDEDRKPSDPV